MNIRGTSEYTAPWKSKPIWISSGLAILFWMVDAVIDVLVFNKGPFLSQLLTPSLHETWMRLLICIALIPASYSLFGTARRKRIEEHLRDSEEKYRCLAENIGIGISVISPEMEILSLNRQMKIWFAGIDDAKKPICYKAFNNPPRQEICSYCPTSKTLADGQVHEAVTDTPVGDEIRHYMVRSSPINNIQGEVIAAIEMVEDITERIKAEESIKKHVQQWQATFDAINDGIFMADTEGTIMRCNKAFTNIVNMKENEIIGRTCHEIVHGAADFMKGCPYIAAKATSSRKSVDLMAGDKWFSVTVDLILNDAGEITSFVHTISDITKRKIAETAVKESEARYRNLFENAHDMIQSIAPDGRFIFVNPAWLKTTGYTWEEVRTLNVFDIIHSDCKTHCMETFKKVLSGESVYNVDTTFVAKDGRLIDLDGNISVQLVNGKVTAAYGIFRDVTERKKMEEQLFRIKQDWEDTFNTITDMITVHDKDFNIVNYNKAAEKLLRLPVSGIVPVKCYKYYHGTGHPPVGCPSCKCIGSGVSSVNEIFEPHLNMFVEIRAIPRFDRNNNLVGLIHVVRDISERKKIEDQLRQSQKIEAIGELAAGIAHDFNNILTAIIGYANILKLQLGDDPRKANLDNIITSSEKGANLTQSLLAFSRQQTSNPEPVDINGVIRDMEKLLLRVLNENIDLRTNLTGELMVMADSVQMDQVLINLCANARDAMPGGGVLTIETRLLERGQEVIAAYGGQAGDYALISVSDTGEGMSDEIRGRIFEPFYTTKEVGKGTGLGLSIVYGIIRQHNGYIECDSKPGNGATFRIYLPVIKDVSEQADCAKPKALAASEETATILLAEDEMAVRELTTQILEESGYTVIAAADGQDAVNKFMENKDRINLVMLDVIMPKINGKEAYDRMKRIKNDFKELFISGYPADFIHKDDITENGLNFASKPIAPKELLRKVKEVLAQ